MLIENDGYLVKPNPLGGCGDDAWNVRNPWSQVIGADNVFAVAFTFEQTVVHFGVAFDSDVANNPFSTAYDMYLTGTGPYSIAIFESGVNMAGFTAMTGVLCEIISDGTTVEYWYGGVLQFTSPAPPPSGDYKLKTGMLNDNGNGVIITSVML